MEIFNLESMTGGWFIGPFEPSVLKQDNFEVAVKSYKAGEKEPLHVHKIATEITLVLTGKVIMKSEIISAGSGISLSPGESSTFECLEDCLTVVVKSPAVIGDKYLL